MAQFDSGYQEKLTVVDNDVVLLADSQDLSSGKKKVKKGLLSTIATYIYTKLGIGLKADRLAADSQQIPLLNTGDGLVKRDVIQGMPANVYGSLSITANSLSEPTVPKCSFLYVQAGGYIWGLQFDEAPEIPNGYTGVIAPEVTFMRITDIETYKELAGHTTIDEHIYGDYEAVQNTLPIGVALQLTIIKYYEGTDAAENITPLLTLDNSGLINFNMQRARGLQAGVSPTDAANYGQLMNLTSIYDGLYNQSTILSTPTNTFFNLSSVRIANKNITAEVGDAVQFTLPNSGIIFNGEIAEIGDYLECSWTGYTGLPDDDAGSWKINVIVDGVVYPNKEGTIATEYVTQFDGNGLNQEGSLGNHLAVDRIAQMSFVLNSINRIGTKVISQYASSGTEIVCKLNRELANTEGLDTDVWYCYDTTNGSQIVPSIAGSGDTYTLTFTSSTNVYCVFLGENLPFILP